MSFGARFLTYPDLFPGRPSGEPWGDVELHLRLPGSPIRVGGLSAAQTAVLQAHFGAAAAPAGGDGEPLLRLLRAQSADFPPGDAREFDLEFSYLPSAVLIAGWHTMARFDWSPRLSAALWTPDQDGLRFAASFENVCRALAAYRLLAVGGVLVHAAAAADDAGARLFVGRSGAGKTTVWDLLREEGLEGLSDDLNAVRCGAGEARVASTPFSAIAERRQRPLADRPLREIHFLRQGRSRSRRRVSPAEALGRLCASTPFVNRDALRQETLFDIVGTICRTIPAFELTFPREPGLWRWLDESR